MWRARAIARLFELNPFRPVPRRHIREHHPVPLTQPLDDLDGADRAAPEADRHSGRAAVVSVEPEQSYRVIGLPLGRAAYIEHILQAVELDRPIHAQIGSRSLR